MCELCQESFDQFWDEEEEEWHLKDAIRVAGRVSITGLFLYASYHISSVQLMKASFVLHPPAIDN